MVYAVKGLILERKNERGESDGARLGEWRGLG